jgi:hypothetical protein
LRIEDSRSWGASRVARVYSSPLGVSRESGHYDEHLRRAASTRRFDALR